MNNNQTTGLENKTQDEINRAAAMWFMCREAFLAGEKVPEGVFFIDVNDPSDKNIELVQKYDYWMKSIRK